MTEQYAIDMAKKLFREQEKSYYVIHFSDANEFKVVDKEELQKNKVEWNRHVVFAIEAE